MKLQLRSIFTVVSFFAVCNCLTQTNQTVFPTANTTGFVQPYTAVTTYSTICVGGSFQGTVQFGNTSFTAVGTYDGVLWCINDFTFELMWSVRVGGSGSEQLLSMALDSNNEFVVVLTFQGTSDFGGGSLTSNSGSYDIVLLKLTSTGTFKWNKLYGGAGTDYPGKVAVDSNDNIYVAGTFTTTSNWGGSTWTAVGSTDWALAKYNATGKHLWSKNWGSSGMDSLLALAVDSNANVITGGIIVSSYFNLNGVNITQGGSDDSVMIKLDTDGNQLWYKAFANEYAEDLRSVAVDSANNIYITGYFGNVADFGGGNISSSNSDSFLVRYDPNGNFVWQAILGGSSQQYAYNVRVDSDDTIVFSGVYLFVATISNWSLPYSSNSGGFAIKVSSSGEVQWIAGYPGTGASSVLAVPLADNFDNGMIIGFTGSGLKDYNNQTINSTTSSYSTFVGILQEPIPSGWPSRSPTPTPSQSPSPTPTVTPTRTPSSSPSSSRTPSRSPSSSPSVTPTPSPTNSPTSSATPSSSISPSITPNSTPSNTPSGSPSVSPSVTTTPSTTTSTTPSLSPTSTPSISSSATSSRSPSSSVSSAATPSSSGSALPGHRPHSDSSSSHVPLALIAGIAAAGVVVGAIIAGVVIKKRRAQKVPSDNETLTNDSL